MLTDTHCHLDFNKFDEDREAVIQRAMEAGVERILIPALDYESGLAVIKLAQAHANIFAAVGFHPTDLDKWHLDSIEELRSLIAPGHVTLSREAAKGLRHSDGDSPRHDLPGKSRLAVSPDLSLWDKSQAPGPNGRQVSLDTVSHTVPASLQENDRINKIVAIGEIGLDYYWVKEPEKRAFQREALRQQLQLAQAVTKPAIIHMREENDAWFGQASIDLLEILTEWQAELLAQKHPLAEGPGVLHSFNGNLDTAQKAIALNFYIGITGPVTYKNAEEKRQIVRQLPLERLLIETDAPFLTPVPQRGQRNEPAFVAYIADKIAEIHNTTREQVARVTSQNANRLFGWEADS